MTYRVRLPFTAPPLTANDVRQVHWTKQAGVKIEVAEAVVAAVTAAGIPPLPRCAITLEWYAPDYGTRDCDGMYPMLKAVVDALTPPRAAVAKGTPTKAGTPRKKAQAAKVGVGIIPDDNANYVASTTTAIVLGQPDPRIELLIDPLPPLPPRPTRPRRARVPERLSIEALTPPALQPPDGGASWRARVQAAMARRP